MSSFLLEIASFSIESAIIAEKAGAHRIEFCENPSEGGTTPSYGNLKTIRDRVGIPVFPIIRPRGGHFVFSQNEVEAMKNDILLCRQLGFEGVVIGLLNTDGKVDYENTARLVDLAYPLDVTFHRAFDRTPEPFEALETIIRAGCTRLLTSGQAPDVSLQTQMVGQLVQAANHRIILMPGSGVRQNNIAAIAAQTGATEFHSSAGLWQKEPYFSPGSMQEAIEQYRVEAEGVKGMLEALSGYFDTRGQAIT